MTKAGRLLIWATLPWCAFLFYSALTAEGSGTAFQGLFAVLMFGWVPWIAGRVLVMMGQRRRRQN